MPEGDTIRRIADRLAPLTGAAIERATTRGLVRESLAGRGVTAVESYGKHLTITLDDETQIRVHLGMNGGFRAYPRARGEEILARTSPGRASLALVTRDAVYLWLNAPTVEVTARRAPGRGMAMAGLGNDILAETFDPAPAARALLERHPHDAIGPALLDQRTAAGIGNIWKCESLFATGIDPRTPVAALAIEQVIGIFEAARTAMLGALANTRRYFVYERGGQPCLTCGTRIEVYRQQLRWTWSCPSCQRLVQ